MKKKNLAVWILCVVIFLYPLNGLKNILVKASPDEIMNNPSAFDDVDSAFVFETNAYTSNDLYASMGTVGVWKEVHYFDYGFDLGDATIIKAYVYNEHKSGHATDNIDIRVSRNNGLSWSNWYDVEVDPFDYTYETDVTNAYDWQAEDFDDGNFKVSLRANISATGCYHPDSEVGMWEEKTSNFDMTVKKITDVKKGDVLLGYDKTTGQYIPNIMRADATILKGDFTFFRFIAEYPISLWDKEIYPWEDPKEIAYKDLCVTDEQRIFTLEKGLIPAGDVEVGMHFHGLFRQDGMLVTHPIPITKIETIKGDKAVTLDGTSEYFFAHYMLEKIVKTYYLDWLPVKIVYIMEVGYIDCQYIGVNNTIAGQSTLFSADWTDIYGSEGLSHFLYSTNRSGVWENETEWSNSWRDTVWADAEGILNDWEYMEAFRFYINNTAGIEYASTICFFPTRLAPSAFNPVYYMVGGISFLPLSLVFAYLLRRRNNAS